MQILVVDDIESHRKLLCAILDSAGHHTVEAEDGLQAMAVLGSETVDAVISDILMPNMDGFSLCNEIRKDARLCTLPFIVYSSTYTSHPDLQLGESVGADRYLIKPAPRESILKALHEAVLIAKKHPPAPQPSRLQDTGVFKQYSRTLVNKLEEKNTDLHQTLEALQLANQQIGRLNTDLEQRVRTRTAELQQANRELTSRNREVQSFYHTLSHELKTPLTSAREFVSMVIDGLAGPVNAKQREFLAIALESCDQLHTHIDDLLDTARLETGKLPVQMEVVSLATIVERVLARLNPLAKQKNIHLRHEFAALPNARVDPGRITQVVTNLLNNALKFTPPDGVIAVKIYQDPQDSRLQRVSIADTGCGIAPDQLEHIFDRFYQVNGDEHSASQSLGLGLYICRELLTLHGGKISVRSEPGKGSNFSFTVTTASTQPT